MNDQLKHYSDKLEYEIDSWDLNVAREAGENITVVDARSSEAFHREHIPGAINIPHRTMSPETTRHLDKNAVVVTYCDGIGCNGSTKGAVNMLKLGFRVKELIGGLDWWKRDGHKTHAAGAADESIPTPQPLQIAEPSVVVPSGPSRSAAVSSLTAPLPHPVPASAPPRRPQSLPSRDRPGRRHGTSCAAVAALG